MRVRSGTSDEAGPVHVDLWGPPQGARVGGLLTPNEPAEPQGDRTGPDTSVWAPAGVSGATTSTPGPRWGLPTAVVGVGVWLSLSVLLSTAIMIAALTGSGLTTEEALDNPGLIEDEVFRLAGTGKWFLTLQAGSWVGMGIPILWAYFRGGQLGFRFTRKDVWIGLGFALVAQAGMWLYGLFMQAVGVDLPSNASTLATQTGGFLVAAVIGAAIISPVVEEVFFRGVFLGAVQRKARKWLGPAISGVLAILVSSAVFGAFHFTEPTLGGGMLILATGLLGAGLAVLRVKTGRLGGAIIGHVLFNSFSLAMTLLG